MKLWRKLTLPILQIFPELTELYDETCLLENPFFSVTDLDCSPCMDVLNVLDLSNVSDYTESIPFVFKANTSRVNLNSIYREYNKHKNMFIENKANKIKSIIRKSTTINVDKMFTNLLTINTQNDLLDNYLWRINRMEPARILRQLFNIESNRLPTSGQSVERFLTIDTSSGMPYTLPDTDCSNVFLLQVYGTRTIVLRPTKECKTECRTISVRLTESYILNYDWWYWKPITIPEFTATTTAISYIISYC